MGINEYGLSFGIPFKYMSWGITAKYVQGLFFLGVDEDSSSSSLLTDDLGIYGNGKYIIKELCHHFEAKRSFTSMTLVRDTFGLYGGQS